MPISLEQLRRERDLIAHHLAWLDARIAEEEGLGRVAPPSPLAPLPSPASVAAPPAARPATQPAGATPPLPIDFDPDLRHASAEDARKGCLKLFAAAVLLFIGMLVVAYFLWPDPATTR